jgi:GTP:adenosylcobinamide-phosphate guanylyltransferase
MIHFSVKITIFQLFKNVRRIWYSIFPSEKCPLINILTRTSGRPNYFDHCIESIVKQSYCRIKVYVSYDNTESYNYVRKYKNIEKIRVSPHTGDYPDMEIERGVAVAKFPSNLYLNDLQNLVKEGYIIILDDDDILTNKNSIATIVDHIKGNDDLLFWRVQFPNNIVIPEDEYFGKPPVYCHISGIGFAFDCKYSKDAKWDGYKGGDFGVVKNLFKTIPNKIYINEVLTGLQRNEGWGGMGSQDDRDD